ncbi:hypothetical protein [Cohnella nanjingensis]|uniref:hypothetical protein n=1 Tax=Cohnella nanjingensis TaxID=1387779 RepID=UPI001C86C504|nr:hypothetical protein [Cohnella nanjingensis]
MSPIKTERVITLIRLFFAPATSPRLPVGAKRSKQPAQVSGGGRWSKKSTISPHEGAWWQVIVEKIDYY